MKPHEILQKIIDESGFCDWVVHSDDNYICSKCPMGGVKSCTRFVADKEGDFTNDNYIKVAKKLLADMEVDRILLGEEIEE